MKKDKDRTEGEEECGQDERKEEKEEDGKEKKKRRSWRWYIELHNVNDTDEVGEKN